MDCSGRETSTPEALSALLETVNGSIKNERTNDRPVAIDKDLYPSNYRSTSIPQDWASFIRRFDVEAAGATSGPVNRLSGDSFRHRARLVRSHPVARRTTSARRQPTNTGKWRTVRMNVSNPILGDMTIHRMDNVGVVVDDLEAATAFFDALGMELEGEAPVEGRWVDGVVGLDNVRADIAMMRTPDGHSRLELTKFHTPAAVRAEPHNAPANTLGIRRIMFAVEDIEDTLVRLQPLGAQLIGEVEQYEEIYRLCYVRGPAGIIVALAEQLS